MVLAAACTPGPSAATPAPLVLIPYETTTPLPSPVVPSDVVVVADTPLATSTPSQYTIRAGDTLSQIAEQHRITLDALMLANPQANPGALRVGDTLNIPASPANLAGQATPTPVALPVRQAACHPTANGAVWCFVLVENDGPDMIENVTAQITLVDSSGAPLESKVGLLPLNILPAGTAMPLSAFFLPPLPLDVRPRVQMLTAIRILPGDGRYLAASTQHVVTSVTWRGRSAHVTGEILLPATSPGASLIWIAATAYDRGGMIVGWRRWEGSGPFQAGSAMPFDLTVSSVAGPIDRVELAVEARP